jgi:hypothetical protein
MAPKEDQIPVPSVMVERHESLYNTVDCRADY